jgi:GntR family transcriptional repressor for pyruvate dehydrogenase complex
MTDPKPKPKRAMVLAGHLRARILRGELAIGEVLPTERELIESSNVSRFTVREALRVLESEGLLEIRRGVGGGPRVRHPGIETAALAVGAQLQLRDVPIMDAWITRSDLVRAAIADLAVEPSGEIVDLLEASVDQLAAFSTDEEFIDAWMTLTEEFVECAGSKTRYVLVQALHEIAAAQLGAANDVAAEVIATEFRSWLISSCRSIVDFIRAGDAQAACRAFDEQTTQQTVGMAAIFGPAAVVDIFPSYGVSQGPPS